jgi:hypothetical protein
MTTVKSVLYGTTPEGLILPLTSTNDTNLLITQSNIIPTNGTFLLDSPNGTLMQADSSPKATTSPDGYKGWYYINADTKGGTNLKMNWYFYDGTDRNYLVGDVRLITATLSIRHSFYKPFFVLYTKNGTSRVYTTSEIILEGEKVLFYFGETGYIPQNNENLRLVRCVPTKDNGLVEPFMPVQFLSIHSDSAYPTGEFEMVVQNLGFRMDNITCNFEMLTPATGGGGVTSNVNILSSVALDVVNETLTSMTFTNSTFGSKLLNVFSPELTNVHIISQEEDLNVKVVNTDAIKVIQTNTTTNYNFILSDFVDYKSPSINIVKSNIQAVFGIASISGMSLGVPLGIEYSVDNDPNPAKWYNSQTSLTMINGVSFGASYQLGAPYIRFVLGGTNVTDITLNVCCK